MTFCSLLLHEQRDASVSLISQKQLVPDVMATLKPNFLNLLISETMNVIK